MTSQVFRAAGSRSKTTAISSFRRANMVDSKEIRGAAYDTLLTWSTLRLRAGNAPRRLSRRLADGFEEPAQNVHLVGLEPRAREHAAQARQQAFRVVRIEKTRRHHRLFKVPVNLLDLLMRGEFEF